ncbi:ATP-binding cassette domain-containing protein [Yinghuangia sp. ASG 101]|uniref:branched-chain amino acid ABC transporter permease/ATP-binding protein n=1 Tax=Yinghuangia sp. ASG 101 TaxID=2896848 RepID=UPI001E313A7E|nr:branched-chain amino acid ABC transporter permease/ATP-binding protein [Yinghuangia sp. ASG 101]UGQ11203.1 ATP-binding cassette domain-containing protein [Yinghuangia sp. ASG 101]
MNDILPFLVSGLAIGSVYGLAGAGLVVTYKTSGIFNFGHGALATIAAYLFYWLHIDQGLGWQLSAALTVLVAGPLLGLLMELVSRRLAEQRIAMKIVGTAGLILLVQGLGSVKYGPDPRSVPSFLPKAEESFRVASVNVQYKYVFTTVIAVAVVAALWALFRFSRTGLAMRAVVDDPDLLDIKGTNPARVRRAAWIIGSMFASLSGVLLLPLMGLEPIALTFLVVTAFGSAAVGAFTSIPLTFAGGLLVGVAADVSKKYVLDVTWLSGLPSSLPFIVLFAALLLTPRRKLTPPSVFERRPPLQWHAPARIRLATAVAVILVLTLVPTFAGSKLTFYTVGLTQVVMFMSLGLLVRTSGQVSLCHAAFGAIGAVAFSQFAVDHNIPWVIALLLGALVVVPVGAIVAIPAIRLSGLFLALATLGFGIMVERLFYPLDWMFTSVSTGRLMPRPSFAEDDNAYYWFVLALVVVIGVATEAVQRGRLGRMLRGMAEAPVAVSTSGLSTNVTKLIVFCVSAFIAGLSGILYGATLHSAGTTDVHYSSFQSVVLLVSLAIAPFAAPWYAVFIGMTAIIPAYFTNADTSYWMNAAFGFFAVQVAMAGGAPPMPARLRAALDRLGGRRADGEGAPADSAETAAESVDSADTGKDVERKDVGDKAAQAKGAQAKDTRDRHTGDRSPRTQEGEGLRVDGVSVRFGGVTAVDGLTLNAPTGRITGLIGPNGAGKTTTFNACTGLIRPSEGRVHLHGRDVTRFAPAARGRAGLGRTFQIMNLCDSLSVAENVALGHESGLAGARPLAQLAASRKEARATKAAAEEALRLCGITHLARAQAGALSTGQRRLVELARCLAGGFDVLLLDEPSSGLDHEETARFAEVLERVVRERGTGILLVEHDMALVMRVCSYIYVLDFGKLLFEGDADAVRSSDIVRAAYLGEEDIDPAHQLQEAPS